MSRELRFARELQRKYGRRIGHYEWRCWRYERVFRDLLEAPRLSAVVLSGWRADR